MSEIQQGKNYKSPQRKLVKFFEKSRNQWKAKCREAKQTIKQLKNRIRFLEKSKEEWKSRTKELEAELAQMKANECERGASVYREEPHGRKNPPPPSEQEESEKPKKNKEDTIINGELSDEYESDQDQNEPHEKGVSQESTETSVISVQEGALPQIIPKVFNTIPPYHQYSIGHIMLFISLVLSEAAGLRCTSRAIDAVMTSMQLPLSAPSWFSGRFWLQRVGYYKLMRPKEHTDDWVWIVDHTVQVGDEKCFVILGVRLCDLPPSNNSISHGDVEPIYLSPVKQSNGEVVFQQLEDATSKTGIPREIIGDHGSDLKSGVEKFCEKHQETCYVYDIKHKTASVLKRVLEKDCAWQEFTQLAAQTKRKVQQTQLAALAPPNQRTKARYMNVDILIQWGLKINIFLEKQKKEVNQEFDQKQVEEKFGWVTGFHKDIKEWEELLDIVTTTENFVRTQGLCADSYLELEKLLSDQAHTEQTIKVHNELLNFVREESSKAKPDERLLGSSEVIESVFGKLKRLERDQSKSGFTGLLLSVPAMVSKTTREVVRDALEMVPTKKVLDWCKNNLGQSVQAKRRSAFASSDKPEQKWDQFSGAG
jgi:hypothetical protein